MGKLPNYENFSLSLFKPGEEVQAVVAGKIVQVEFSMYRNTWTYNLDTTNGETLCINESDIKGLVNHDV